MRHSQPLSVRERSAPGGIRTNESDRPRALRMTSHRRSLKLFGIASDLGVDSDAVRRAFDGTILFAWVLDRRRHQAFLDLHVEARP